MNNDKDHNDESAFEIQRRTVLRQVLHAGFWTMAGSSGLFAPLVHALGEVRGQLPDGKSVHDLRGEVKVDGNKANLDTSIGANALVETGSNSYIIFAIGKDAHILRENSRVQFSGGKSGIIVKNDKNNVESGLNLLTGKLLSVFGKRQNGETHTMTTTTATIGIRGTGVYTESEKDRSYICTCYGVVNLQSSKDENSSEQIMSRHHDAPRYVLADGKAGSLIIPGPFKNHSDEELMLIEAIVGRKPPLSSVKGYSSPRKDY